ncbi:MAG: hypothetical protein R3C19_19755 [Planctomycetaceae bacterium]
MRNFLFKLMVVGIVGVLSPVTHACWWPWFPAYGVGYAPYAAPYGGYGYGAYYGGYQPVSYASYAAPANYAPVYTASYGTFAASSCNTGCCDSCNTCGVACSSGCGSGSCGVACIGVESGTLRPSTDPISNKGTGETARPQRREEPDRSRRGTYEDPVDNRSSNPPTFDPDRDAPMFGPGSSTDDTTGAGGRSGDPDWIRSREGSGNEVDDILNRELPEDFRRARRPITTPVDEPADGKSSQEGETGADSDSSKGTEKSKGDDIDAPESDLGKEVSPIDFLAPPTDDEERAAVEPLMLTQSRLRSSHFDVLTASRLAAESRRRESASNTDTRISDSKVRERTIRWISVPAPEGRVRL